MLKLRQIAPIPYVTPPPNKDELAAKVGELVIQLNKAMRACASSGLIVEPGYQTCQCNDIKSGWTFTFDAINVRVSEQLV